MFWVDLSTAKLLDGNFTVAQAYMLAIPPSVSASDVPKYFPAARIGKGNYVFVWSGGWGSDGKNYFGLSAVLSMDLTSDGTPNSNVTITPMEAYNIDSKIDDGLPQSGSVMTVYAHTACGNTALSWAAGGTYDPTCGATYSGDHDGSGGPVVAGDGVATAPSSTTCYDNSGVAGGIEHYSVGFQNGVNPNCALSFRFQ
jgi:hypothetical protein